MTVDPFAASRARRAKFIDAEMALGFRSNVAGVVAIHMAAKFGIRTFPAWAGTKFPRYAGWQNKATANPASIAFWIRRFQFPEFIVPTGRGNGIVVLDIDGAGGRARLAELEAKHGALPKTWKVSTGREDGGFHLWFRAPDGRELKSVGHAMIDGKRDSVDQKGRGGFVVCAGSLHASGRRYRWDDGCAPDECELAQLPEAWLAILDWADDHPERPTAQQGKPSARHGSPGKLVHDPASDLIGDGPGFGGFQGPLYKNAIRYFLNAGVDAPAEPIVTALREMIEAAPKGPGRDVSRYVTGPDLPRIVERARCFSKSVREQESAEHYYYG